MSKFLIDEDLPKSLAPMLVGLGFDAIDCRSVGLRSKPDPQILQYAVSNGMALVTRDTGFGNILVFPLETHKGIVLVRYPNEVMSAALNQAIAEGLRVIADEDLSATLIILDPGGLRIRRRSA